MSEKVYYAHSKEGASKEEWQELDVHLQNVGRLTQKFAGVVGTWELGSLVGKYHDIGKASSNWQKYLEGESSNKPDHRIAGAILAAQRAPEIVVFPILGHHGGLKSPSEVKTILCNGSADKRVQEAIQLFSNEKSPVVELPEFISTSSSANNKRTCEFFIRMLLSALVDADYLDTEAFADPIKAGLRQNKYEISLLNDAFQRSQANLIPTGELNRIRTRLYNSVMESAGTERGFFSMSIPTGGGKTRTAMGFALKHALHHDLNRIIVVIPYTSIIEQTAKVYKEIFGEKAVVEHHSSLGDDQETEWNKLATENWDAPIIVTTSVQFFNSLHANRPGSCRKLHNIPRSVVILDEVQTLPPGLLAPTLDVMRELVKNYDVSFVFSTATQPAFSKREGFDGLESVRELAPDAHKMFESFKRVDYEFPPELVDCTWESLAEKLMTNRQALAIVNTKKDAAQLFRLTQDAPTFHLSSSMCPQHRRLVLKEVTEKLKSDLPCRLISTQVVEAGVDIDFPVLYRAFGPMDSIVQAAGRCNREGKIEKGRAIIFQPDKGGMPPGAYRTAADLSRIMLSDIGPEKLHETETFRQYFSRLYDVSSLDEKKILEKRENLNYPETAAGYNIISADTRPVVVPWGKGQKIVAEIAGKPYLSKNDFATIQNYTVNLWSHQLKKALIGGLCSEIRPGLFRWCGKYDDRLGVVLEQIDPEKLIC